MTGPGHSAWRETLLIRHLKSLKRVQFFSASFRKSKKKFNHFRIFNDLEKCKLNISFYKATKGKTRQPRGVPPRYAITRAVMPSRHFRPRECHTWYVRPRNCTPGNLPGNHGKIYSDVLKIKYSQCYTIQSFKTFCTRNTVSRTAKTLQNSKCITNGRTDAVK